MSTRIIFVLLSNFIALIVFASNAAANGAAGWDSENGNSVSVNASSSSSMTHVKPDDDQGYSDVARTTGTGHAPLCSLVPLAASTAAALPPGGPTPGQWYVLACNGQDFIPSTGLFWMPTGNPPAAAASPINPLTLAEKAADEIRLPPPSIYTNPSGTTYANFDTWLWIDPDVWHPLVAKASAGTVTATATATPSSVTWSMGDGSTVVCEGPGTAYDQGEPPGEQSTECSYTYRETSSGEPSSDGDPNDAAFPVTATITWSVTWTATGAPGGGSLPALETSSTVPLRVEQVESVGTTD